MKKFLMMLMVVLASSVMFMTDSAEAARIGGGRSVGRQNSSRMAVVPASAWGCWVGWPPVWA